MSHLFRLDASIRVEGSQSRALGDIVEAEWISGEADPQITRRHVGVDPIPATAWADAVGGWPLPESERTPAQRDAVELARTLADELIDADGLLFAVPLYNFGVSQHFKTWADLVITDPRIGPGAAEAIAGKPAVLVTVQGGNYSEGTPRAGWDHSTGWITRILADVWNLDLRGVSREFTLVGVNPAMDSFADVAAELRVAAEEEARRHGRELASARVAA